MADKEKELFEDCPDDMIVLYNEATDKDEKFYVLEIMDYKNRQFIVMQPAEHLEDIADNELLIYELGDEDDEENFLIPIEDEKLLQEVFDKFMKEAEEYENALKESSKNGCNGVCAGCSGCDDHASCDCDGDCKK